MAELFPEVKEWKLYDLDPKNENIIKRDTLLNPLDYTGKTIITNPPYLAKNNTKDFRDIFEKYHVDDLYKAALLSFIGCRDGFLILPINFFTDQSSAVVRNEFLSKYKVKKVNVFTKPMFENTTYNVCSFYFEKGKTDEVEFYNFETAKIVSTVLKEEYDFRLGGEFFKSFEDVNPIFFRDLDRTPNTNLFLRCLDKREAKISLEYIPDFIYKNKKTDRIYATLSCKVKLSREEQEELAKKFRVFLNDERKKYNNLILSNYRDFGRKRISFADAYKICTMIYEKEIKGANIWRK